VNLIYPKKKLLELWKEFFKTNQKCKEKITKIIIYSPLGRNTGNELYVVMRLATDCWKGSANIKKEDRNEFLAGFSPLILRQANSINTILLFHFLFSLKVL
jgi:hypothetical protein